MLVDAGFDEETDIGSDMMLNEKSIDVVFYQVIVGAKYSISEE